MVEYKMVSNGVFGTSSLLNLEILTTLECFLAMAYTIAYYWTVVSLLYLTCVRDFCEIFMFTTLKITERVIWALEVAGFVQIPEKSKGLVPFRGIGTQTDRYVNKEIEPVSSMTVNDIKISSSENKINHTNSLRQNSEYELQLTRSHRNIVATRNLNVPDEIDEPALMILNNNKASPAEVCSQLQHTSQSPVCRLHLTPCPTNLRAKYAKVIVGKISPEERSCLKRKWQSWSFKNGKKKQCLRMQPLFSSDPEKYSSGERNQKKARTTDGYDGDNNQDRQLVIDEESPVVSGCYKNVMLKLKSKFLRCDNAFASYKKF